VRREGRRYPRNLRHGALLRAACVDRRAAVANVCCPWPSCGPADRRGGPGKPSPALFVAPVRSHLLPGRPAPPTATSTPLNGTHRSRRLRKEGEADSPLTQQQGGVVARFYEIRSARGAYRLVQIKESNVPYEVQTRRPFGLHYNPATDPRPWWLAL